MTPPLCHRMREPHALIPHADFDVAASSLDDVLTGVRARSPLPLWIRPMTALVVDPDPLRRARSRRALEREGYAIVMTCAGPDVTACPAVADLVPSPCTLVDPGIGRVVLAPRYVERLQAHYRKWLPDAFVGASRGRSSARVV